MKTAVQKALELSSVPGKATDLEKMYIAAIAARRDEKAKDQDEAFVGSFVPLWRSIRTRLRQRLYLALMIMRGFTLPDKKPNVRLNRSRHDVAAAAVEDAPDHPGCASLRDPRVRGFRLSPRMRGRAARRYAELVPNIPHALHMPGHIWAQTGRWDDAIQSFDTAAVNERGYMNADSPIWQSAITRTMCISSRLRTRFAAITTRQLPRQRTPRDEGKSARGEGRWRTRALLSRRAGSR